MPSRRIRLVGGKDRATVTGPCLIYLIVESRPLFSAIILTKSNQEKLRDVTALNVV